MGIMNIQCCPSLLAIAHELIHAGVNIYWKHVFYYKKMVEANHGWVFSAVEAFVHSTVICMDTLLHAACLNGKSQEVVESLFAAGADINATVFSYDGFKYIPLISVTKSNAPILSQLGIACLLLAVNCNVNYKRQDGDIALIIACCHCNSDELVC